MGVSAMSESAATVRHLIRTMASYGVALEEGESAAEPVFRARVAAAHAGALWEQAARAIGPGVPLLVANKRTDDRISPLFFAAMAQRTLGGALQATVRHWRYATEAVGARMIHRGGLVHLRLEAARPMGLGARLGLEYLLADLARSGRDLSAADWRPVEVVLAAPPPGGLAAWEDFCRTRVRIDPDAPGLVMARDALELRVHAALPDAAGRLFDQVLAWLAPPARAHVSTAQQVAAVVMRALSAPPPSVAEVAHELAMSPRSLHRRLEAERTTFQRVVDRVRCDEAIRCVLDRERQLKAVASAVGFADLRGFRRAFKRWTGVSPQQFRLAGSPAAGAARLPRWQTRPCT